MSSSRFPNAPLDARVSRAAISATLEAILERGPQGMPTWQPGPGTIPGGVAPVDLLLRLTDLPHGYLLGDESGCGPWSYAEGGSAELLVLLMERQPIACARQFTQYTTTRPADQARRVASIVVIFRDEAAAAAGFDLGVPILAVITGDQGWRRGESPAGPLREADQFLYTDQAFAPDGPTTASAVLWRDRNLLHFVEAVGLEGSANRDYALRLAGIQRLHQSAPSTTAPRANDDREVRLDRPNLGVPVYWLGRDYAPEGLPPVTLAYAYAPIEPGGGPGWRVELEYNGFEIGIWKHAQWEKYLGTDLGRAVWDTPCVRATEAALSEGRAVIYGGYHRLPADGTCPSKPPDYYLAHVYLPDAVVSVNVPFYLGWPDDEAGDAKNPYNSRAGMEAVLSGLRRR